MAFDGKIASGLRSGGEAMPVTEKAFSEFHLYTIGAPTTLRDHETKQVEFVRAQGVKAPRIFVYDGGTQNYGAYPMYRGSGDYDGIPA